MQKRPYRAIVSDMDGTLLNEHHVIGDFTAQTLEHLYDNKVDIILATGRNYFDVSSILKKTKVKEAVLITSNGAQAHNLQGGLLLNNSLPEEIAYQVMNLPFVDNIKRADRDNTIDLYIGDESEDVLADGTWQQFFKSKPEPLTLQEKRQWIAQNNGVCLGSDAFFPFGDNIERAHKSGVDFIAQAGGSVRDDHVVATCDKYNIAMAFTGVRLFHH